MLCLLLAVCCNLSQAKAAVDDDDLLLQLVPIIAAGSPAAMIKSIAEKHATWAEPQIALDDLVAAVSFVIEYPPGTAPAELTFSPEDGGWITDIGSMSAAFFVLGAQAVAQDSRTVALWCFAAAVYDNPTDPIYVNSLAFELIEHGFPGDAEKLLRWVVKTAPEFSEARVNLAYVVSERGLHAEAGELYQEAARLDPSDSHAMYAAAREYLQAGMLAEAWVMATLGQDAFPTHFDFLELLDGMDYPPAPGTCVVPVCQSQACSDVLAQQGVELGTNLLPVLNNYDSTVAGPAAQQNATLLSTLYSKAIDHQQNVCPQYFSPYYEICRCEGERSYAEARLIYDRRTYWQDIKDLGFYDSAHEAAWSRVMAYYAQRRNEMTPGESQTLACWLDAQRAELKQLRADAQRQELASDLGAIELAKSEMAAVALFSCRESIFYMWVFTIEAIAGLEPKYCGGPVCVSKDAASGDEAIEMNFVAAVKFARNPHTGRGSITVGLGHSTGVATHNYGAAIQATIGGDKVGIVGKLNAGWVEGGVFVGFKYQRSSWSSYNPVAN
jgi:tetratricopeptide (TPR) repeat protein